MNIDSILRASPVMPVLVVPKLEHAVPLAKAMVSGGVPVLEVTLRTSAALDAIRAMRDAVPQAIVGAGTIMNPKDFAAAVKAGASFIISPGLTPNLLACAKDYDVPLLPGTANVSDIMLALDHGIEYLKFFPAREAGGPAMLKAFFGPIPQAKFCPTGGITLEDAPSYLSLPNVLCVGGSWLAPKELVEAGDWAAIEARARAAVSALKKG